MISIALCLGSSTISSSSRRSSSFILVPQRPHFVTLEDRRAPHPGHNRSSLLFTSVSGVVRPLCIFSARVLPIPLTLEISSMDAFLRSSMLRKPAFQKFSALARPILGTNENISIVIRFSSGVAYSPFFLRPSSLSLSRYFSDSALPMPFLEPFPFVRLLPQLLHVLSEEETALPQKGHLRSLFSLLSILLPEFLS